MSTALAGSPQYFFRFKILLGVDMVRPEVTAMWFREFKDYPIDSTLLHNQVESGKGIVGCEMHDRMGWGNQIHRSPERRKGVLATLLSSLFGSEEIGSDVKHP